MRNFFISKRDSGIEEIFGVFLSPPNDASPVQFRSAPNPHCKHNKNSEQQGSSIVSMAVLRDAT